MSADQPADQRRDPIVFEVEVEPGPGPINGLIRAADREVEFVGWVGLAGAIETVLGPAGRAGEEKSLGWSPP